MTNYPSILRSLALRCLCSSPFWLLGWVLVMRADGGWAAAGQLMIAMALFITGAVIVAPAIAELVAEPVGSLYLPADNADHPAPMFGIADALRAKGDYEAALAYLDQIAAAHPHELDSYVKMIHVAALDLHDLPRAEAAYHRGVKAMPTDGDKAALTVMFQALTSRHKAPTRTESGRAPSLPTK